MLPVPHPILFIPASCQVLSCPSAQHLSTAHHLHSHRLAGSVLAYFGFGLIELLLSFISNKINLFPDGFFRSASTSGFLAVRDMQIGTLVALIQIAIYGFLCWYLLDHRLNLE